MGTSVFGKLIRESTMGTPVSRPMEASPCSPEVPAAPAGGAPATIPVTTSSPTPYNRQPSRSKRELHMFREILAGGNFTEEQAATTGIILHGKTKKYWVDRNGNNCFMLFPRGLSIAWGENPNYWAWYRLEEGSDAGVEVAELMNVCWVGIIGKLELSYLTPGVTYEAVFEVMLRRNAAGWHVPVDLQLKFPDGRVQQRKESLQARHSEEPLHLKVGDVKARAGLVGELEISLSEHGGHWKRGLVLKGIRITPKA